MKTVLYSNLTLLASTLAAPGRTRVGARPARVARDSRRHL